ncbi:MAG: DUF3574 domain-containing protein [Pseudonocardiaceae bacterium]
MGSSWTAAVLLPHRTILWALLVVGPVAACGGTPLPTASATAMVAQCGPTGTTSYLRTDLLFGKSIPSGGTVTDQAFAGFLDQEVTPRFPAGFTVVPTMGQYRETTGVIDHEASDMIILLYPQSSAGDASRKIDEIRAAYTKTFHQEAVLREDEPPACVSF